MAKKYYWIKLQKDFFSSKRIKKLRKLGADFVIIYLKMQLLCVDNDGMITYDGLEDDFATEIALDIDEDVDKVALTISYLQACGLIETSEDAYFLPYVEAMTGSEGSSAERMRNHRKRQKLSQCDTEVTPMLQIGDGEKEKEKELELEKEIEIESEKKKESNSRFAPPSLEEVQQYIWDKGYSVNAESFYYYYESNGWRVGKNKMKSWQSAIAQWNARDKQQNKSNSLEKTKTMLQDFMEDDDEIF